MPVRTSTAQWKGTLKEGTGTMRLGSGAFEGPFTFKSRFESDPEANPEELIGAAHAGCFSMFLSALLSGEGFTPTSIETSAKVHLGDGPTIVKIELDTVATVPGLSEEAFQTHVAAAKANCPISKALAAVPEITLTAKLMA
jgi:osmotically inducible protein OsmC